MTLDATVPADSDLISVFANYLRGTRTAVNTLETTVAGLGAIATVSTVTINGSTTLITGTHVEDVPFEIIIITATGSETLNNITGGTEGQIKFIWLLSGSLTFADDDAKLSNNGDADFVGATGDVIAYVNKNGDGAGTDGYWHELFRTVRS